MFKVGDVVVPSYEYGNGSFRIVEILSDTHMLVTDMEDDFGLNFAVNIREWGLDPVQFRRTKLTKILGKLKNKK